MIDAWYRIAVAGSLAFGAAFAYWVHPLVHLLLKTVGISCP